MVRYYLNADTFVVGVIQSGIGIEFPWLGVRWSGNNDERFLCEVVCV